MPSLYLALLSKAPESGLLIGTTDRGLPVSLVVSADGNSWTKFQLKTDFDLSSCWGTVTITVVGPGAITNNKFGSSGSTFRFSGQLDSPTAASGSYSFVDYYLLNCGYLTQTGTWTASKP